MSFKYFNKAGEFFKQCIQINPKSIFSYFNLALALLYSKEYLQSTDEILEILEKCLSLDSQFFPARFEDCKIKSIIGKTDGLSIDQKEYIEKNLPQYQICYYDYAKLILNTKNIKQKVNKQIYTPYYKLHNYYNILTY